MKTPPPSIRTDNTACRICMNCCYYTDALRTREHHPCCICSLAARATQPYAAACTHFCPKTQPTLQK